MNISDLLSYKYPNETQNGQIVLRDDGQGIYIREWHVQDIPQPTNDEILSWENEAKLLKFKAEATELINRHVETTAQEKGYDNGFACATYINSTIPQWQAEAQAFVAWRDNVWLFAITNLQQIEAGQVPIPELDELIGLLPQIEWPDVS